MCIFFRLHPKQTSSNILSSLFLFLSLILVADHQMDVEKQKMADVHKRGELVFLRNKVTSSKQEIANLKKVVQQKEDDIALTRKQLRDRDAKMVRSIFFHLWTRFSCSFACLVLCFQCLEINLLECVG